MNEPCQRCNEEPADTHIETMTRSECLCEHCALVAFGLILAPPVEPFVGSGDRFSQGA